MLLRERALHGAVLHSHGADRRQRKHAGGDGDADRDDDRALCMRPQADEREVDRNKRPATRSRHGQNTNRVRPDPSVHCLLC